MVSTLTPLTLRLAEAIGLYLIAAGISGLRLRGRWSGIMADIARSPGIADLFGVASFAIGVAILIPHHHFADPLAAIVTVTAALLAIFGLLLLAFPDRLQPGLDAFARAERLWSIVLLILGSVLILAGLTGRADYIP